MSQIMGLGMGGGLREGRGDYSIGGGLETAVWSQRWLGERAAVAG
ncbi:MAG: hypothetical protein OT477_09890 [Chloroflexi bacterium]|nr:hypothetical protein [Chloroflexota bacterium]